MKTSTFLLLSVLVIGLEPTGLAGASSVGGADAIVINEVMASNASTVADPQRQYDDWVELHNTGDAPVDVAGLYLTDDRDVATMWRIATGGSRVTRIAPGGFLIVWLDDDVSDPGLHANFRLGADGDDIYLFASDGVTLLDSLTFDRQTPDVSYGRYPDGGDELRFFGEPTPGQANGEGYLGEVAPLRFSHERGFYDDAFDLRIATATEGAEITYTLDGRPPGEARYRRGFEPTYTGPIRISQTTCVRAVARKPGWKPTQVVTHTYIFDARSEIRSLPVISLVGDSGHTFYEPDGVMAIVGGTYSPTWTPTGSGSYNNVIKRGLERPVSAEWIIPPYTGRGAREPVDGFQIDCGLRVHGSNYMRPRYERQEGYWTGRGKFSFRLYFRGRYGHSRLEYPLFPLSDVEEFASIVLRGGHNDRTNPFIKDELIRRLHSDMGQRACMGTFANLFINGQYKGYYNLTEHVKEESCQEWFDSEMPWDVMTMNGIRDGNTQSWNEMIGYARSHNLADPSHYAEMGTRLDVPAFIDYLIARLWPNDWDWPQNNWSAVAERSETGQWKFFVWDAEGTFRSYELDETRFDELNGQGNANGILYRALKASPEFRRLFGDRLHQHFFNGGAMVQENIETHFLTMRHELRDVIPNMDTYIVNGWAPSRQNILLDACVREGLYTFGGPTLAINGSPQHGGHADAGDRLHILPAGHGGRIYYTMDGSDPAGNAMPGAADIDTLVTPDASKRILVPSRPDGGLWRRVRGFDDSAWTLSSGEPGGVGYERNAGYEGYISTDVGDRMYGTNASCYIRIPFQFDGDVAELDRMTLHVQYDDGFVAYLNDQEVARRNFDGEPAWDSVASANHSDSASVAFEPIDISSHRSGLRNGKNLLAIHGLNRSTTSSDFLINVELTVSRVLPVEEPTEGNVYSTPIPLRRSTRVKARLMNGSTWSALTETTFAVGPVLENLRISEIMYHPIDPNAEYVELTNVGSEPIHLNLATFTDGIDFAFGDTALAPGDFCLIVKDRGAFEALYGPHLPVVGQYAGSLSDAGERLELRDAAGAVIQSFRYSDDWHDLTDGAGFSLTAVDPLFPLPSDRADSWRLSAVLGGSPGYDDSAETHPADSIVINEVLANSVGGPDWIELHNTTDATVDIGGWFISDDADNLAKYRIVPETEIAPDGYFLLYEDQQFGNGADPGCAEPFALSRVGETLYLHSAAAGLPGGYSQRMEFAASAPGVSLGRHRKGAGDFSLIPLVEPTPGASNADPAVGPVVITEIMYHHPDSTDIEYVELRNISDEEIVLFDAQRAAAWRFTDDPADPGIDFLFPYDPRVILAPGEYVLLTSSRTLLDDRYSIPASIQVFEWDAGRLGNAGEMLQLSRPGEPDEDVPVWLPVDRVHYSDGSQHEAFPDGLDPWPPEADGKGLSLTRTVIGAYGDDPQNWRAAEPSPGVSRSRLHR